METNDAKGGYYMTAANPMLSHAVNQSHSKRMHRLYPGDGIVGCRLRGTTCFSMEHVHRSMAMGMNSEGKLSKYLLVCSPFGM